MVSTRGTRRDGRALVYQPESRPQSTEGRYSRPMSSEPPTIDAAPTLPRPAPVSRLAMAPLAMRSSRDVGPGANP